VIYEPKSLVFARFGLLPRVVCYTFKAPTVLLSGSSVYDQIRGGLLQKRLGPQKTIELGGRQNAKDRRTSLTNWRFIFQKWVTGKYDSEPEVIAAFRRIHGKLFVDVGANVGRYAVGLRDNFDEIIAIEPNPRAGDMLLKRAAKNRGRNVKLIRSAISNKPGPVTLYFDSSTLVDRLARRLRPYQGFSGSVSTIMAEFDYKPAYASQPDRLYKGKKGITVNAVPLDYIISNRTVDLCKIDVEGAEFLVLESATNALKEGRIIRIMVELHNRERKSELESFLERHEFRFRWLDPGRVYGEHVEQKSVTN